MDDSVTIYGRDPWISLSCNTHGSQHLSNKGLEERLVGRQESPAPQLCMLEEGKGSRMRVILTLSITVWKDSRVKPHSALRQEKQGQNDSCGKFSLKQDQAILDSLHPTAETDNANFHLPSLTPNTHFLQQNSGL